MGLLVGFLRDWGGTLLRGGGHGEGTVGSRRCGVDRGWGGVLRRCCSFNLEKRLDIFFFLHLFTTA